MEMGIMLLVVVLLGAWVASRSRKWKTLQTATAPNSEQLQAKYAHLKSNNIKCKLVTDSGPAAGAGMVPDADVLQRGVLKLKVHEKHMKQAKELLEEFPEAM